MFVFFHFFESKTFASLKIKAFLLKNHQSFKSNALCSIEVNTASVLSIC